MNLTLSKKMEKATLTTGLLHVIFQNYGEVDNHINIVSLIKRRQFTSKTVYFEQHDCNILNVAIIILIY